MRLFVFFVSILISVCYAAIGEFDNDLANIGQYIASDTKRTYHPYAPSSPNPDTAWDYEVEGFFPTHGYVSHRFFTNNRTGSIRTCFRTFGGKACDPATNLANAFRSTMRILDVYFCFTGLPDGPETSDSKIVFEDLRFGVYVPRFTPGLGFEDLKFTSGNIDLSQFSVGSGVGPPSTFSRLMQVMKKSGGQSYQRNISFVEFTYWYVDRHPRVADKTWLDGYYSYNTNGKIVKPPFSEELDGLIRFNFVPAGTGCTARNSDTVCPDDVLDPVECLYGQTIFPSFMSKCSLVEDLYSVRCLDPKFLSIYGSLWKEDGGVGGVLAGATNLFSRNDGTVVTGYLSTAQYGRWSTAGYIAFPSWNEDLPGYFTPDFQAGINAKTNNRHFASIRTIYPVDQIKNYKIKLTDGSNDYPQFWGRENNQGYNPYWRFLGRGTAENAVMMRCPVARNAAPGVYNGTKCNAGPDNGNNCNSEIGRCFCDNSWFGIACDIPFPQSVLERTQDPLQWILDVVGISAQQNDSFQICSTAGKFSSQPTVFYLPETPTTTRGITLPLCECMPGFEGTPTDIKSFIPVYASLFHVVAVSKSVTRIPGGFADTHANFVEWFTPYHSDKFKQDHGPIFDGLDASVLSNIRKDDFSDTNQAKFFYNWAWYILKHQCLIWKPSAIIPPLNVYWDYQSFPFALDRGASEFDYRSKRMIYPWPPISTTNRHHQQGIRCMDYDETDCTINWSASQDPQFYTCQFLTYLYNGPYTNSYDHWAATGIPKARLYGGDDCSPCPDCNRQHSDCVTVSTSIPILQWTPNGCRTTQVSAPKAINSDADLAPILQLFTGDTSHRFIWRDSETSINFGVYDCISPCVRNDEHLSGIGSGAVLGNSGAPESFCHQQVSVGATITKKNACKCDPNYCGSTCNTQMCPVSSSNGKVCGNGTCVSNPTISCDSLPSGVTFPGTCRCDNGWEGPTCDTPICPFDFQGKMCGHGTCDPVARRCVCSPADVFGGPACDQQACPMGHGLECSGAVIFGTQQSVCNRNTGKCDCFKTMPFPAVRSTTGLKGWDATDVTVHWKGKWGVACEHDYGEVCRDAASGLWCSQAIDSNGNIQLPASPGYAGCYNKTCQNLGLDASGHECRPSCKCTLEYSTSQNCEMSICGHDKCGIGGRCHLSCVDANSQTTVGCSSSEAITKGLTDIKAECICGVANGNFYASKVKGDPCDTAAPICYTGDSSSPCNQRGDCVWNSTTFVCHCDPGHFGAQCEVTPACLNPLGGPCGYCVHLFGQNNPVSCSCPFNYLRDANRACTQERCLTSGGQIAPGNETCICPRGLPFHAIPEISNKVDTQTKLGCRKGCPINPDVSSVECGANEQVMINGAVRNRSRCVDLMNDDPIYGDDARPAPVCNCSFFARDTAGGTNYFISDGNGGCKPKCNPIGLCKPGFCDGFRVDPVTFACECNRGWSGENCDLQACNGHMHHSNIDGTGPCVCDTWCRTGANCEIDTCALSGGVCSGPAPNDCDCSANDLLKLNNSQSTRRSCISACQNGGVLNIDFSQCLCPQPYYGRWCEQRQQCHVQFNGSNCDISLCLNGGTPRPKDQVGCVCSDSYYQGELCQVDICSSSGRMHRSISGCVCNTGWTGSSCSDSTCLPGGEPDPVTGYCNCKAGYNRTADNIGCSVLMPVECVNGKSAFRADGSQYCACEYNYTGTDCSVLACAAPFIVLHKSVDNKAICGCPPTLYGDQCTESYCSFGSWFNPATNSTECKCPFDYKLAVDGDPITGVRQCVPNPYICDPFGTVDWSNVANHFPCKCKSGFSGDSCNQVVTPTSSGGGGDDDGGGGVSTAEIAGIAGGLAGVALVVGGVYYFCKFKYNTRTKMRHRKKSYSRIE